MPYIYKITNDINDKLYITYRTKNIITNMKFYLNSKNKQIFSFLIIN